ncbi:MAG: exodeoxyribonuclease V subunit gamma [Oscillospiraceae bacterium]|nr:exodeoxyribonuclease V subunit gamma [Oscillospiraceae bacterium]
MLTLVLGTDWTANRDMILEMLAKDVTNEKTGVILMVPELISHDTERRLCAAAGDTASRFAEVLTFTRLAKRVADAAGYGAPECLDNGGRLVAMASATRQLHSKLKAYAAVETRPDFLTGLLDAVDEFKRCCITPADLQAASGRTEGSFAQKLEELSLILEAYDALCARGKRDPRDQMTWLLEQLEDSSFAEQHSFYIDGFPDFTRQHTAILGHLISKSDSVVVSLNCDCVDSQNPAFEKAGATAGELLRLAKQYGVQAQIVTVQPGTEGVKSVIPALFQGRIQKNTDALQVYTAESVYRECHAAAEQVVDIVRAGGRYRDISIVCADMAAYGNVISMIFDRYHIPVYLSGTEDILSKSVMTTVLSAIDAAVEGFEQGDVLRYLKSPLSPLTVSQCDKVENYALLWRITGSTWGKVWTNHPNGLSNQWTEQDNAYLGELNRLREKALNPLLNLGKAMRGAVSLGQLVDGLYAFLRDIELDTRLEELASQLAQSGDLRNSQILGQLWDILLSALEQLDGMLGDTHWDAPTFTRLLKLLLSRYDVGTIPAVLDAVTVGSVSAMRCQQTKHLLVLGANEGVFPTYSGTSGVLTDRERTELRTLGVPLTGGAMEGLQAEFADIYGVFCGATETVRVSCSDQPSFLYRRLCEMAGGETAVSPMGIATTDPREAGAYLARIDDSCAAEKLGLLENYQQLKRQNTHNLGQLTSATVNMLYGETLNLSASQVDKLADCRLAYFLKYGLKLKERKPATVDPAEFGTYVHAVLEDTARRVMDLGGFHRISLQETLEIANQFSQRYIAEHFSQIDSQRLNYLFRRNAQELEMVVAELWEELQASEFAPIAFELGFGPGNEMDAIYVSGHAMSARLRGFVDRVDAWKNEHCTYYRVVDYKTGKKDFDYCDIYNGLGLQMLLYLFALEEKGSELLGQNPVAAGVQYFPARVPLVSLDGRADETEAEKERIKLWKRKGLLLAEEAVLNAMEPTDKPIRLSYTRKKDGSISGDLADSGQLKLLKAYIFALLGKMVDDIASGNVEPNPYTRGGRHNACAFCPYGAVCHDATVEGRRNYAAITPQKFWEDIEKEMSSRG